MLIIKKIKKIVDFIPSLYHENRVDFGLRQVTVSVGITDYRNCRRLIFEPLLLHVEYHISRAYDNL